MSVENNSDVFEEFQTILQGLNTFKTQIIVMQTQIKLLEKNVKKQMKNLNKKITKHDNKSAKKSQTLSGFAKPSKVSKELCEFMNKEEGTEIARTEVTRALVSYIKEHNLENIENKKIISPDEKLKFLLGIDKEELTYFTIQKYMNKHFVTNKATNNKEE
jgi:chromatin remodeling complex protein RSC6